MLIYNHKFEFIGADKKDLNKLGFKTFTDLQVECDDFADLFIKKPGYIHNFKNLKWILYILNSNTQESKALLMANKITFATNLVIDIAYMKDNPDKESYIVTLQNLHQVGTSQADIISEPSVKTQDNLIPADEESKKLSAIPDAGINTDEDSILQSGQEPATKNSQPLRSPMLGDYISTTQHETQHEISGYEYDPKIAADELGLPIDLIEEFIGDFIQQTYDFKSDLYSALNNEDYDKVKNLSHKLKGVAANLRIEDAFEVLRIINTSPDIEEIRHHLDIFYDIIHKLDNKKQNISKTTDRVVPTQEESILVDDDIYANLLKNNDTRTTKPSDILDEQSTQLKEPLINQEDKMVVPLENLSTYNNLVMPTKEEQKVATASIIELNYDKQKAIYELGLDKDIVNELLHAFKEQSTITTNQMRNAIKLNDIKQIHKLAINIKGVSDNLRLTKISSLLQILISSDIDYEIKKNIDIFSQYITQL